MNAALPYSAAAALAFVAEHGVVLASAKGPVPRLIDAIAGEPVVGHWWSHPRANHIYNVLAEVQESEQVLVCRMVHDKVTLVHRRLWPALAYLAARFDAKQIARRTEKHTAKGHHIAHEVPFPAWVPRAVLAEALALTEEEALASVGHWLPAAASAATDTARPKQSRKRNDA